MTKSTANATPALAVDHTTAGLDNVVAAETVLSHVDGMAGRLILRGYDLDRLADWSFEAVLALLWRDLLPEALDESAIRVKLGAARQRAFSLLTPLLPSTDGLSSVEALRLLLSTLADAEPDAHHILAVAAVPVFAAAIARRRRGEAAVTPDARLGLAADFLRMLHGAEVDAGKVRALDTYLVTVADHGLNASTFTARVIASTKAGLFSSVIGGLCALKGPLHGGAPGPVIEMLDAIGEPANARAWLEDALGRGERLMGFGHRIYRVRDPRADALKQAIAKLGADAGRLRHAEAVEQVALAILRERKPGRSLETNVEFYTALLLEALGFPPEAFTCVFAMGRTAGWIAHAREQLASGRLIRPQSVYVGPRPDLAA